MIGGNAMQGSSEIIPSPWHLYVLPRILVVRAAF